MDIKIEFYNKETNNDREFKGASMEIEFEEEEPELEGVFIQDKSDSLYLSKWSLLNDVKRITIK